MLCKEASALWRVRVSEPHAPEREQDFAGVPTLQVLGRMVYVSQGGGAAFLRCPGRQESWTVVQLHGRNVATLAHEVNSVHRLVFDEETPAQEFDDAGRAVASEARVLPPLEGGLPCCSVAGAAQADLNGAYWWADGQHRRALPWCNTFWGPDGRDTHFLYETRCGTFSVSPAECFEMVHTGRDCGDLVFVGAQAFRNIQGGWAESQASLRPFLQLLRISGAAGPSAGVVNGVYRPTSELRGHRTVFQKEGDEGWCLCFLEDRQRWVQLNRKCKEDQLGLLCAAQNTKAILPTHVSSWSVSTDGENWTVQPVQVSEVSELDAASPEVEPPQAALVPPSVPPVSELAARAFEAEPPPQPAAAPPQPAAASPEASETARAPEGQRRQLSRSSAGGARGSARPRKAARREPPREEAALRRRRGDEAPELPPEASVDLEELRELAASWESSAGGTNLAEAWQWYERYLRQGDHHGPGTVGLEPLRLRGFPSDLKVAYEVLGRDGYRPPCRNTAFDIFAVVPGDVVLDGGGNIGAYAHWALRQGAAHVDVYEPAWFGSTWAQLRRNCRDSRFTLHNRGLGTSSCTEYLLDLERCRAGASRSTVQAFNTYSNRGWLAGSELCEVDIVCFDEVIGGHRVIKLDLEGSELPILDRPHDWHDARLLHVEYSANRCRADEGEPWQRFASSLKNLEAGGWTHVYIPPEVYRARFWFKRGGRGLDFNVWAFRESADPQWYKRVNCSEATMAALEDLRMKWTLFSTIVQDPRGF